MFRPLTVIAITAFCVVGWNVYRAEDAARHLDRDLRDLNRRIEVARDRTQVLKAEWALLNEPERLRQVAQKHLTLETMVPGQFIRLPEMDRRLPTAIAFAGPVNLFAQVPGSAVAMAANAALATVAPDAAAVNGAAPSGTTAAVAAHAAPAAPQAPVVVAAPSPAPAPRVEQARAEQPRPEPVRQPAALAASRVEEPRRRGVPAPAPRAETVALREMPRAPMVAEAPAAGAGSLLRQALHLPISSANAAPVSRAPVPGTGASIGAPGGSSLGFAARGSLPPPVPVR